ncbi:MAG: alpha-1,4 polygalactosaminidase, partial [Planktomarina sp.]
MTDFTIASFNVKNLISADQEYYKFESYTPEEHAWKQDWLADQLLTMNTDIVCFQEIFEQAALEAVIADVDAQGAELNASVIPDRSKKYRRKAIFRKLAHETYNDAALAFAPNANDGEPGQRRPGLAVLSRFGFVGEPEVIQDLSP